MLHLNKIHKGYKYSIACLGRWSDQQPAASGDDPGKMARNGGILACYSRGTSDPLRVVGPPMEAHCGAKQRAKSSQAIGTGMQRGGGRDRVKMHHKPGQEDTVFDSAGAPPLRFWPSKARFVGNYAKNAVQKDLTGGGTLYTK